MSASTLKALGWVLLVIGILAGFAIWVAWIVAIALFITIRIFAGVLENQEEQIDLLEDILNTLNAPRLPSVAENGEQN